MNLSPPRRLQITAAALFLLCSALYFLTRSPALDEWDSVQFAQGVSHFDIWQHRPHPPGYPLYIACGWLGSHLLPLSVPEALALGSAVGGGLFVAGWFLLLARRFAFPVAFVTALTLATLLITWMTATKVLTDGLEAGVLALTLLVLDGAGERAFLLGAGALLAAAAAGVRPQNTGVLLLIVVLAAWRGRTYPWRWLVALGNFFAGCLAWLLPTMWLQAHTPEANGDWWAYPHQLLAQWRWRLDQPKAFLGATGQTAGLLLSRVEHHWLGWLTRGAGFALNAPWGWAAIAMVALGFAFYVWMPRSGDGPFWRRQLPWVVAYASMIFCCLPGDQRYYLPIFPLLTLPIVAGWWLVLGRGRWLIAIIPLVTCAVSLPYAIENHREPAPPVRLVRWLQSAWPPAQRPGVCLILRDSLRHAQWYAPEFKILPAQDIQRWPTELAGTGAVYTDDAVIAAHPPAGAHWDRIQTFSRSPLIYRKHNEADLYRLAPQPLVE